MIPDYYAKELYHYGVAGMKWGVRRATRKASRNVKLGRKALGFDEQSASLTRASEKAHAKYDLERSNRKASKAAKHVAKAARLKQKASTADTEVKRTKLERKAANKEYKAAKLRIDANQISKSAGYGGQAMKLSIKSDKVAKKAAKARKKIAKNNAYIAMMDRKVSKLSTEERDGKYAFVKEYLDKR